MSSTSEDDEDLGGPLGVSASTSGAVGKTVCSVKTKHEKAKSVVITHSKERVALMSASKLAGHTQAGVTRGKGKLKQVEQKLVSVAVESDTKQITDAYAAFVDETLKHKHDFGVGLSMMQGAYQAQRRAEDRFDRLLQRHGMGAKENAEWKTDENYFPELFSPDWGYVDDTKKGKDGVKDESEEIRNQLQDAVRDGIRFVLFKMSQAPGWEQPAWWKDNFLADLMKPDCGGTAWQHAWEMCMGDKEIKEAMESDDPGIVHHTDGVPVHSCAVVDFKIQKTETCETLFVKPAGITAISMNYKDDRKHGWKVAKFYKVLQKLGKLDKAELAGPPETTELDEFLEEKRVGLEKQKAFFREGVPTPIPLMYLPTSDEDPGDDSQ